MFLLCTPKTSKLQQKNIYRNEYQSASHNNIYICERIMIVYDRISSLHQKHRHLHGWMLDPLNTGTFRTLLNDSILLKPSILPQKEVRSTFLGEPNNHQTGTHELQVINDHQLTSHLPILAALALGHGALRPAPVDERSSVLQWLYFGAFDRSRVSKNKR